MTQPICLNQNASFTTIPSPRSVFGCFIESGFGRQVSGMWAEMLFNRAFRRVPPYKAPTWFWLGIDSSLYGPDAPFWHSGYEEYDWEDIGKPVREYTLGNLTYKGKTSLLVTNPLEGEACGLRQRGIRLEAGREYVLTLTAGLLGELSQAGLNGFGDTVESEKVLPLRIRLGKTCFEAGLTAPVRKFEFSFAAPESGSFTLSLSFSFQGTVVFAASSLMPADAVGGWRREIVDSMRTLGLGPVRFPGGCFTSFFDWEASIGPRDEREPQESHYWGGLEENDVGIDEFLFLSREVGFEPQITFNMMTSSPFKARQLVEYCNAPESEGMGRLRALNGHREPYGVKLFEMDNEPARKWTAEQYARKCAEFAAEMRLADPSIRFLFAAYAYPPEALPKMLEIAGNDVNYVVYRDGSPKFVRKLLPVIEAWNAAHGTSIRLANTEWLAPCSSPEPFERLGVSQHFSWHSEITNNYDDMIPTHERSWNYALNGAQRLLEYLSYGGMFAHANFNNMTNTWGQNLIEASKEKVWLSGMGKVFAFFAERYTPSRASEAGTGSETLYALETKDEKGRKKLWLVNHASKACEVVLPAEYRGRVSGLVGKGRLWGEEAERKNVSEIRMPASEVLSVPGLSFLCVE